MATCKVVRLSTAAPLRRLSAVAGASSAAGGAGSVRKPLTVLRTPREFHAARGSMGKLGFVPTMGNLHAGHVSLVRQAKTECDTVAASIFVNPTQFARHEDLDKYPRTLQADIDKLEEAGCDVLFLPSALDMYPRPTITEGDHTAQRGTIVEVKGLSHQMEGTIRPHFFRGVATVVAKLFVVVMPDRAYFGQKDAQQCIVIRNMTRDLLFPTEIIIGPTLRDPDGLAMSSRNGYLTPSDRAAGLCLYRGLSAAQRLFASGVRDREVLINSAVEVVNAESRVKLQYLSLAHPATLEELPTVSNDGAILSGAILTSSTRLIDNVLLGMPYGL